LTRSYESNGPDVKIRGNAQHVAEKYLQLARDAHTGGDPVAAEAYLQHAEHYFRLIAAAQAAQALAQSGQARPNGESEMDDLEDEDDFGALSDRFASPSEQRSGGPYPQNGFQGQTVAAPNAPQPFVERQPFDPERPNDRPGFVPRQDRQGNRFPDRGPRPDRPFGDRQEGYRDNRQNRDNPRREFRPFRDAPVGPPREGGGESGGATALPAFITSAPRAAPAETEGAPQPAGEPPLAQPAPEPAESAGAFAASSEARFPGRGRRRRLRSPYGFNAAQGDMDDHQTPNPIDETPPVGE
jgi:hypothetical protein